MSVEAVPVVSPDKNVLVQPLVQKLLRGAIQDLQETQLLSIPVTLEGKFVSEVRGRTVTLLTRQFFSGIIQILELRAHPFISGDKPVNCLASIALTEAAEGKSGTTFVRAVENAARQYFMIQEFEKKKTPAYKLSKPEKRKQEAELTEEEEDDLEHFFGDEEDCEEEDHDEDYVPKKKVKPKDAVPALNAPERPKRGPGRPRGSTRERIYFSYKERLVMGQVHRPSSEIADIFKMTITDVEKTRKKLMEKLKCQNVEELCMEVRRRQAWKRER